MTARAYPLPRPESGNDPRFSFGLIHDVGKVLEAYGFPSVRNGSDHVDLGQALFAFVFGSADRPVPAVAAEQCKARILGTVDQFSTEEQRSYALCHLAGYLGEGVGRGLPISADDLAEAFERAAAFVLRMKLGAVAEVVAEDSSAQVQISATDMTASDAEDDSPLTFAEYRDAIPYWQRRVESAESAGDQAAAEQSRRCLKLLQERVTRAEVVAQRCDWHPDLSEEQVLVLASNAGAGVAR